MIERRFRAARVWSNQRLRELAPLFTGSVVNVSGSDDLDKEGGAYREYFAQASDYSITNFPGASYRGFQGREGEIPLDLSNDLPGALSERFDVVFNHTTLEHIFDLKQAFENLCRLSKDIVILIVPFSQVQHESEGYKDYWRFTPTCVRALFERCSMEVIYEAANNDFNTAVYLLMVGSKNPARWKERLPDYQPIEEAASWLGTEPSLPILLVELSRYLKSHWLKSTRTAARPFRKIAARLRRIAPGD